MSEKFRIAVLGIGGVGGYFGGKLAARFAGSEDVEIIFIARGEHGKAIKDSGLKVITTQEEFIARPKLVTNEAVEIGEVDVFIICTKAYDLEESIIGFSSCISEKTAILPLLNGVDNAEKIQKIFPTAEVWNGCAFIASRLIAPGVVKVSSDMKLLQFGGSNSARAKLEKTKSLFQSAGINTELKDDIEKAVWEKFIFISSLATLTSFLDTNAGGINRSVENQQLLKDLIEEVTQLAQAKRINVDANIARLTFDKITGLPDEITSSMHSDFQKKSKTELETLTGYVVREAELLNLPTPVYNRLYDDLKKRK